MKSSKNRYQVVVVLSPKMKDKNREILLDKVRMEIEKEGVKMKKREGLGLKNLSYTIAGFDQGDFWIFEVCGKDGIKLDKVNVFLNRESYIIRYLILKVF